MRFLHTGDWQIGMPAHFLKDDDARFRFNAARIEAIRTLTALAAAQNCDFIAVAGDVFDTNRLSAQILGRALEAMADSPVPIYLLPGNHDCLEAWNVYQNPAFARHADRIRVLTDAGLHDAPGGQIAAVPWPSKRPGRDLVAQTLAGLPPTPPDTPRILLGHGQLDTLQPDRVAAETISSTALRAALDGGIIHFAALGDRHILTDAGIGGRVWFAGTPEPTDYVETEPGFALVVDVDADGPPKVTPHKVSTWTFEDMHADVNGIGDVEALAARLQAMPAKDRTAVRLAMTGTLTLAADAELQLALDEARPVFAALEVWKSHTDVAVLPDDGDMTKLNLTGYAADAAETLKATAAAGGPDAGAAQAALGLLYRLAVSA